MAQVNAIGVHFSRTHETCPSGRTTTTHFFGSLFSVISTRSRSSPSNSRILPHTAESFVSVTSVRRENGTSCALEATRSSIFSSVESSRSAWTNEAASVFAMADKRVTHVSFRKPMKRTTHLRIDQEMMSSDDTTRPDGHILNHV